MTIAHIGLAAQGLILLAYFRPNRMAALAALLWFGASDFVDYGLGFYPAIPEALVSLEVVQWSTITVTVLLVALYWLYSSTFDPGSEPVIDPENSPSRRVVTGVAETTSTGAATGALQTSNTSKR
jgi:hypothetical protein